MLLQFSVANFRSFKDETVFSMFPAKSRIHPDHVLQDNEKGKPVKAIPFTAIYGANASGKSNLVKALSFAKQLIMEGTKGEQVIRVTPFQLDAACRIKPSKFEFIVKHEGVVYTYGFSVSPACVEEEWLFAIPNRHEVRYFERCIKESKPYIEVGDALAKKKNTKQRLQFIAEGTRPNQLFLTECNERNFEALVPLKRWFASHLNIISLENEFAQHLLRAYKDKEFKEFIETFLTKADTGVQGIFVHSKKIDNKLFLDVTEKFLQNRENAVAEIDKKDSIMDLHFETEQNIPYLLELKTLHKTNQKEEIEFDTEAESDGTLRIIQIAPMLLDMQKTKKVYVIDEIDRSMHPLLCRFVIQAFLQGCKQAASGSQLIVTTHDTNLLDLDFLRRDEILFMEKDAEGGSHITSLADYEVRSDLRIDKGYLNGRFGAIPFLGDPQKLMKKQ